MFEKELMIELHYVSCSCQGTGWINYPGIGPRAETCLSKNIIFIKESEWKLLGKLKTADEYLVFSLRDKG